jgi:4-aminobutyrate aminotransferase-like enzyme
VLEEARRGGLLLGKGGLQGNVLRVAPPLSITREEAVEGLTISSEAVRRAAG